MKIKHFTAPNMTTALEQIRDELGDEAIIVSTDEQGGHVVVTAAVENSDNIDFDKNEQLEISPARQIYDDVKIRESLEYHDVLPEISGQILAIARQIHMQSGETDNRILLAKSLERLFRFSSLLEGEKKNKIFMGIPGCGKSTVIAKLATKAKFKKLQTCIISTDNLRAGANSQLEALAKILQTDFYCSRTARELFDVVQNGQNKYDLLLIDTAGINPYIEDEVALIEEMTESIKADRVLVADAGRNTLEAVETAEIFKLQGAEFLLPTHLDMTRRIGSVLSGAYAGGMSLCAAGVSADIAKGLADVTPEALAKLLMTE